MPDTTPSPAAIKNNLVFRAILATLLFTQASLIAYLSWSTSPNRTEAGHIGAAVYLWHTDKFDVFHVNPPLVRAGAGIGVRLAAPFGKAWTSGNETAGVSGTEIAG